MENITVDDTNSPDKNKRRNMPTTPAERVITLALFFATIIVITLILARS